VTRSVSQARSDLGVEVGGHPDAADSPGAGSRAPLLDPLPAVYRLGISLHMLGMPSVATPLLRSLLDCAETRLSEPERALVLDVLEEAEATASDLVHGRAALGSRPARWHFLRLTAGMQSDEASADFERAGRELELGRADVAVQALDDVLDEDERFLGSGHPAMAHTLAAAGVVHALDGDCESGLELLDRARRVLREALGSDVARRSILRVRIDAFRGHCLAKQHIYTRSEDVLVAASVASRRALGKQHPLHALVMSELAQTRLSLAEHRLRPLCGIGAVVTGLAGGGEAVDTSVRSTSRGSKHGGGREATRGRRGRRRDRKGTRGRTRSRNE